MGEKRITRLGNTPDPRREICCVCYVVGRLLLVLQERSRIIVGTNYSRARSVAVLAALVFAAGLLSLVGVKPTEAAFPGANRKIAFTSTRDGNNEVYTMNADGTGQTRLTSNSAQDTDAAYSPDGTRMAFVSTRDGIQEIYVMDADPSTTDTPTNLINSTVADDADPAYSPNGQSIVFTSVDRNAGFHFLTVMDTDPTTNDLLALHADGTVDREPAFSPDGQRITYTSFDLGQQQVFVAGATSAGPGPVNISNNADVAEVDPDWGILPVDLSFVQVDSRDPVKVGTNLTYTLTITNTGTNATNVVITDRLSSGGLFVSATSGCTHSSGTVTCNVGTVDRGPTRISQITVNPSAAGTITNAVSVSSDSRELVTEDNSDRERTQVFNNRLPVANSDGYVLDEDTLLTTSSFNGVLRDDTDADGDTPTATRSRLPRSPTRRTAR
jgi:uncharacterized repeat protein (TIGR01451 family)